MSEAYTNPLRQALADGVQLGLGVMYPSSGVIERIGPDWDWIWIDGQHGEFGYNDVLAAVRACNLVRRPAVVGVLASESVSLATIVDTSIMWALCDVPESGASRIAVGQKATVIVEGGGKSGFVGKIEWISAEVDPRTRTVTARIVVPNPDGQLRANQFARARVETNSPRTAVSVPRAAIQRVGEHEVVFIRTAQGVYFPRVVRRLGGGDNVQVEGSVRHGDAVVTTGAILLRTEITPGSIGAGCGSWPCRAIGR